MRFIDLGGVDGLVHISQISHEHVAKASDKLEVGQEVQAKVISVDLKADISIIINQKDTLAGFPTHPKMIEFSGAKSIKIIDNFFLIINS